MSFIERMTKSIFNGYVPDEEEVYDFDYYTLIVKPKIKGDDG